jgi:hypothetical protein
MKPLLASSLRYAVGTILAVLIAFTAFAQQSAGPIKLPAERGAQLKQIVDRQNELAREFQALEAQKLIVQQRAALELKLNAEQYDKLELALEGGAFVFKPKPAPSPAPATKPR